MARFRSKESRLRLLEAAKRHYRLMSDQEVREARDSTGKIPIKHLPNLAKSLQMSYSDLLKVLKMCPLSDRFGWAAN